MSFLEYVPAFLFIKAALAALKRALKDVDFSEVRCRLVVVQSTETLSRLMPAMNFQTVPLRSRSKTSKVASDRFGPAR